MRKYLLFIGLLLMSIFDSDAQDLSQYIGKCRIYQLPTFDNEVYTANISSTFGSLYGERATASKISVFNGTNFYEYPTGHGYYVEFQYSHKVTAGYSSSWHMMFCAYGYGLCAFVIEGNSLCIVKLKDDTIVSVLDSNFQAGDDFSIMVRDDSSLYGNRFEPSIWIVNNGYVKVFNNISSHVSSVRSVEADKNSCKTFNIQGIETANPINGVYIQKGKKVIINKEH